MSTVFFLDNLREREYSEVWDHNIRRDLTEIGLRV
jgi:hypothetical protein